MKIKNVNSFHTAKLFLKSWLNLDCIITMVGILILSASSLHAQTKSEVSSTKVVTERLDWKMIKANNNFGYTTEEIKKYFDQPQVFKYNYDGYASNLVKAPPAPGIHPRVLFYNEDLPSIRKNLEQTKPGKYAMDGIRKALTGYITGPNATYAKEYQDAANGIESPALPEVELACSIIYEAFRCLIDNDNTGGKKAAAAMATMAKMESVKLDQYAAKTDPSKLLTAPYFDYQEVRNVTQSGLLGLGYDFAYNWMTSAQRETVRATIVKTTANFSFIGLQALPAFPANTSNWIPMHTPFVFLICAIEGEKGYDAEAYKRLVSGYKRYLSVGFFPAGEMFESMGKNFLCVQNTLPICARGENLMALTQVRNQVVNYYLSAMDPWGGAFTFYDSLGGRGNVTPMNDVMMVKRMFPNDPVVDFVYRNVSGNDYRIFKSTVHFGHPLYVGEGLIKALFATPYDESKTYEQAHQLATTNKPLTYYSDDTGNMITRSTWDKDALQLHSLTRVVAGGHVYADRSHFSIHALGRYFVIYKPLRQVEEHFAPKNRSVELIDGNGPGYAPSRSLAFVDNAAATFTVGDFKTSYDWTTGGNNRFPKGGVRVPFTANDFRLHKSDKPWMNIPYSDLPNWQTSKKGSELWLPFHPVQRAFRTTGLVRGNHNYVLITDDFQQDSAEHDYQFGISLEDDLEQKSVTVEAGKNFRKDIILASKVKTDTRQLLVRILNANGTDEKAPAVMDSYELPNQSMKIITMNRMVIKSRSVAPDYKVLFFPHNDGQSLPTTNWNKDHTKLTLAWSDQVDEVTYAKGTDGRTRINIKRNGKEIINVD
jgi:hypothetical protein